MAGKFQRDRSRGNGKRLVGLGQLAESLYRIFESRIRRVVFTEPVRWLDAPEASATDLATEFLRIQLRVAAELI